ncbi:major facilitator superfamily domain-containing protein [Penicillium subrubescens]|uniref:major facilitator superfamily domain-containing protein n=1 Tax=Penicillium subrubescens TaxID=1316194 RepID=UPI0025458EAD|nr:major facilitator superfamily domain-containing protein [Penicillium subrubescens]KAJ5900804.1 major facilitator superfamily domain-containing protein [Penicillium subrubescens]
MVSYRQLDLLLPDYLGSGFDSSIYFILYETRGDVILAKRAKRLRQQTGRPIYTKTELEMPGAWERLKFSTTRPTRMLITEPVVTFFTLWVSFAWGILFLFFRQLGYFYRRPAELPILVGAIIGLTFNPIQNAMYKQFARRNKETHTPGKPIPEARLYTSIPGSLLFAGGLFSYGWGRVGHGSVHWIVPTLGIEYTGIGIYSILMTVINYMTDAYERYAASALSATSLGRNVMSVLLPLSSPALFHHLGFGWAGTLLGFIGVALSTVPVVLVLKEPEIRQRSPFIQASTFD